MGLTTLLLFLEKGRAGQESSHCYNGAKRAFITAIEHFASSFWPNLLLFKEQSYSVRAQYQSNGP